MKIENFSWNDSLPTIVKVSFNQVLSQTVTPWFYQGLKCPLHSCPSFCGKLYSSPTWAVTVGTGAWRGTSSSGSGGTSDSGGSANASASHSRDDIR